MAQPSSQGRHKEAQAPYDARRHSITDTCHDSRLGESSQTNLVLVVVCRPAEHQGGRVHYPPDTIAASLGARRLNQSLAFVRVFF